MLRGRRASRRQLTLRLSPARMGKRNTMARWEYCDVTWQPEQVIVTTVDDNISR